MGNGCARDAVAVKSLAVESEDATTAFSVATPEQPSINNSKGANNPHQQTSTAALEEIRVPNIPVAEATTSASSDQRALDSTPRPKICRWPEHKANKDPRKVFGSRYR